MSAALSMRRSFDIHTTSSAGMATVPVLLIVIIQSVLRPIVGTLPAPDESNVTIAAKENTVQRIRE